MKLVLDTNFLLLPAQFRIDIYSKLAHYKLFTADSCVKELEKVSKGGGKGGKEASVALAIANKKIKEGIVSVIETKLPADTAIKELAASGYAVATNDKKLIKDLKSYDVKIIRLRQRKYVAEE